MDDDKKKEGLQQNKPSGGKSSERENGEDSQVSGLIKTDSEQVLGSEMDLLDPQDIQHMDPETQTRLKAFLEVAGVKLSHVDARTFQDPEILRKLTNR